MTKTVFRHCLGTVTASAWLIGTLTPMNARCAEKASEASAPLSVGTTQRSTIAYEKYHLPNGLEVILHHDSAMPLVAVNIWYHVGPVNEPRGRSGFAHLFEHLMFEGSEHVGPNFDRLLEAVGATNSNGTTGWDRTNYFETVPRQHLELVLWIESDRMGFLKESITQQRLDIQRDVVKNERRQTYENAPYGPSTLVLLDTLFPEGHPYHGAVIGSMQDLTAATLQDVHAFADTYYVPSNATLTIAGDIDVNTTKAWVQKYFGTLRSAARPPRRPPIVQAMPKAIRLVVREPVEIARVSMGWLTPPAFTPHHAPLSILASILADGKSSRLYRTLVVDKRLAADVGAEMDPNALSSVVSIDAMVARGTTVEDVERQLELELALISHASPTDTELTRAKKRLRLQLENELELLNAGSGESGRAGLLQRFNHYLGNPAGIAFWQDALNAVKAADISRVAAEYLGSTHRVTVVSEPAEQKP